MALLQLLLIVIRMMLRESREDGRLRGARRIGRYHRSSGRSADAAVLALSVATRRHWQLEPETGTVFGSVDVRTGTGSDAISLVAAVTDCF